MLTVGGHRIPDRRKTATTYLCNQENKSDTENVRVALWVSIFIGLTIEIYTACKSYRKLETPTDVPKWKCLECPVESHKSEEIHWSLQHGYHSNPTTPKLQHTSNQEQYDQCGNSTKLLMMDILMYETCWAHKKWNKIASDIKLVFYSSATGFLT